MRFVVGRQCCVPLFSMERSKRRRQVLQLQLWRAHIVCMYVNVCVEGEGGGGGRGAAGVESKGGTTTQAAQQHSLTLLAPVSRWPCTALRNTASTQAPAAAGRWRGSSTYPRAPTSDAGLRSLQPTVGLCVCGGGGADGFRRAALAGGSHTVYATPRRRSLASSDPPAETGLQVQPHTPPTTTTHPTHAVAGPGVSCSPARRSPSPSRSPSPPPRRCAEHPARNGAASPWLQHAREF